MSDDLPDAETLARRLDEAMERIAELEEKLAARDARIAELEHELNQDSSNSHRPPSTDEPWENDDEIEASTLRELEEVFNTRFDDYNNRRRYTSL